MKQNLQLSELFLAVAKDHRASVQHLCLFMGLCYWWTQNKCQSPISISRKIVMDVSKIKSTATYHKCMKQLHDMGYIKYLPSYHPDLASTVFIQPLHKASAVDRAASALVKDPAIPGET